jgi:hypothetical protein
MVLAVVLPVLFLLLGLNGSGQLAFAVTAAIILFAVCALPTPATALVRVRGIALRERARRTTFLRLRDPDASGRPRPRAPTAA